MRTVKLLVFTSLLCRPATAHVASIENKARTSRRMASMLDRCINKCTITVVPRSRSGFGTARHGGGRAIRPRYAYSGDGGSDHAGTIREEE